MKTYELMPEEAMIYATSTPKALNLNLYEEDGVPTRMDVKGVVRYMGNLIDFLKTKRIDLKLKTDSFEHN